MKSALLIYFYCLLASTNFNTIHCLSNTTIHPTDTEVEDMISKRTVNLATAPQIFPNKTDDFKFSDNEDLRRNLSEHSGTNHTNLNNATVELIQNGEHTEDGKFDRKNEKEELRRQNSAADSKMGRSLVQGQLAGILAGTIVLMSVAAYLGLVMYRKYLERKYGNREMLVNEDDFNPRQDDLRFFSI